MITNWKGIYITECLADFNFERRESSSGTARKFVKEVEDDFIEKVQYLRADLTY